MVITEAAVDIITTMEEAEECITFNTTPRTDNIIISNITIIPTITLVGTGVAEQMLCLWEELPDITVLRITADMAGILDLGDIMLDLFLSVSD